MVEKVTLERAQLGHLTLTDAPFDSKTRDPRVEIKSQSGRTVVVGCANLKTATKLFRLIASATVEEEDAYKIL